MNQAEALVTPVRRVSVCIPMLNEHDNIAAVLARVGNVLAGIGGSGHEIIVVDDGSTDGTSDAIMRHAGTPSWGRIRLLKLSRNFGHQAALTAAIDLVEGDAAFIIDGDLQDRPEELPRFLALLEQGYDVVYGVRTERKESWFLRSCYHLFYRILNKFSDLPVPADSGDYALITRRVVLEMRAAPERNRFLRGIRAWVGYRQVGLTVPRDARAAGETKYSLAKLIKLAADGIFSFSTTPLRLSTFVGLSILAAGVLYAIYAAYVRLILHQSPAGFTALTFLLTIFSGIQLISLGVIGEYVGRIYHEVKHRKSYVVDTYWSTDSKTPGKRDD